jgi:hypothetical protein
VRHSAQRFSPFSPLLKTVLDGLPPHRFQHPTRPDLLRDFNSPTRIIFFGG